jgi:uncharacterized Zn finger protein
MGESDDSSTTVRCPACGAVWPAACEIDCPSNADAGL